MLVSYNRLESQAVAKNNQPVNNAKTTLVMKDFLEYWYCQAFDWGCA
jgi:hypothetical protein